MLHTCQKYMYLGIHYQCNICLQTGSAAVWPAGTDASLQIDRIEDWCAKQLHTSLARLHLHDTEVLQSSYLSFACARNQSHVCPCRSSLFDDSHGLMCLFMWHPHQKGVASCLLQMLDGNGRLLTLTNRCVPSAMLDARTNFQSLAACLTRARNLAAIVSLPCCRRLRHEHNPVLIRQAG